MRARHKFRRNGRRDVRNVSPEIPLIGGLLQLLIPSPVTLDDRAIKRAASQEVHARPLRTKVKHINAEVLAVGT